MKRVVSIILLMVLLSFNLACYADGIFFTESTRPFDVAKEANVNDQNIVPVSNVKQTDELKLLKKGESSTIDILNLVQYGDAGINKAVKDGNIKKIHYVEYHKEKVWIPTPFFGIPISFDKWTTIVYGE